MTSRSRHRTRLGLSAAWGLILALEAGCGTHASALGPRADDPAPAFHLVEPYRGHALADGQWLTTGDGYGVASSPNAVVPVQLPICSPAKASLCFEP